MPIELYFSNNLDQLAEKFSENINTENTDFEKIFEAPVVIVPNQNLVKWLQLTLSKKESIIMNMDFQYLESGLWTMLFSLDETPENIEKLDNDIFKIFLLDVLQNINSIEGDLNPIKSYLSGSDDHNSKNQATRLWQLSEKLAFLFQEYEFHRSEMIKSWTVSGKSDSDMGEMEKWQRILYLKVKDIQKIYSEISDKKLLSMTEYSQEIFSFSDLSQKLKDCEKNKKTVHFFGLSQISDFHLNLIGQLQPFFNIQIYALNPSREFWEDTKTPGEKRWEKRKNVKSLKLIPKEIEEGELFRQEDNPLLSAWGKPGRERSRCQHHDARAGGSEDACLHQACAPTDV